MSTLDPEYKELQLACREFLVTKSYVSMNNEILAAKSVFKKALAAHNIRRLRNGLSEEDLEINESELIAHDAKILSDDFSSKKIDYTATSEDEFGIDDILSDDEFIQSKTESNYPRTFYSYQKFPHYLELRGPRSALFDTLELEIQNMLSQFPRGQQNEVLKDTIAREKLDMAVRIMHLLSAIGEAHSQNYLSGNECSTLGYSYADIQAAQRKTDMAMKALLISDEHLNLENKRESIATLLQRTIGQAIFVQAFSKSYEKQKYIENCSYLNILKSPSENYKAAN